LEVDDDPFDVSAVPPAHRDPRALFDDPQLPAVSGAGRSPNADVRVPVAGVPHTAAQIAGERRGANDAASVIDASR
jgi:hypothetical protein